MADNHNNNFEQNQQDQKQEELKQKATDEVQLQECVKQVEEWKDRCLRTAAEFENFKRRTEKERSLWISSAQSTLLLDLLSIIDDFDRAFAQPSASGDQGFVLIYRSAQKLLEKYGVTEIKDLAHFDPAKHEAIMHVESPDHKSGDIVQVLQKGYEFKNEVLRPAKVSVAK